MPPLLGFQRKQSRLAPGASLYPNQEGDFYRDLKDPPKQKVRIYHFEELRCAVLMRGTQTARRKYCLLRFRGFRTSEPRSLLYQSKQQGQEWSGTGTHPNEFSSEDGFWVCVCSAGVPVQKLHVSLPPGNPTCVQPRMTQHRQVKLRRLVSAFSSTRVEPLL